MYSCNKCGKCFDCISKLQRHYNISSECAIFKSAQEKYLTDEPRCDVCEQRFSKFSNLKRHQDTTKCASILKKQINNKEAEKKAEMEAIQAAKKAEMETIHAVKRDEAINNFQPSAKQFLSKINSEFSILRELIMSSGLTEDTTNEIKNLFLSFRKDFKKICNIKQSSHKCKDDLCDKYASFNYEGNTASFCCDHKVDGMINVKEKMCLTPHCRTQPSNKKYRGYCLRCFVYTFPDETLVSNYKTKEKTVVDFIKEKFEGVDWVYDKKIEGGCSMRRPDIYIDMGSHIIIVEIDENQHNDYDDGCENKRLMEISQDFQHRPIIFIRFNPDSYISRGTKIKSCWVSNELGILIINPLKLDEWKLRLRLLEEQIKYWIENPMEKTVHVVHLYYDN